MGHPLLVFWHRLFVPDQQPVRRRSGRRRTPPPRDTQPTGAVFLVLRRMRAPLIVLILIFSVSVLGLTLVPGVDPEGQPWRMDFFDAFYFMSYTATTIGFGEIPYALTDAQRIWVSFSIYLAVVGWAYAIGSLLAMLQDRGFRHALAVQRFDRQVRHMPEDFVVLAGYGQTGELIGRALDARGRRFTVLDVDPDRIEALDLEPLRADVPALAADASVPARLWAAGLGHPRCEALLAMTDDDHANLAMVLTAQLLRPDVPVIARTVDPAVDHQMTGAGSCAVVNPYDDFGDHLRVALRDPAAYRLRHWLTSPPGSTLPPLRTPPTRGRWVIVGAGRLAREVAADLRHDGLAVEVIDPDAADGTGDPDARLRTELADAVGLLAGTEDDVRNLTVIAAARRLDRRVYVVARQNLPSNAPLFQAADVDLVLVAADVTAHEVLGRLASPGLMRFLREVPRQPPGWADALLDRLVTVCGPATPDTWQVRLDPAGGPALAGRPDPEGVRLGDLLRRPDRRESTLAAVPLLLVRSGETVLAPDAGQPVRAGDRLLMAGSPAARYALDSTLSDPATWEYVRTGVELPTTWIGRRLRRHRPTA